MVVDPGDGRQLGGRGKVAINIDKRISHISVHIHLTTFKSFSIASLLTITCETKNADTTLTVSSKNMLN